MCHDPETGNRYWHHIWDKWVPLGNDLYRSLYGSEYQMRTCKRCGRIQRTSTYV